MRDWVKPLRKAYYDALLNEVTIDSGFVPVFQEKVPENTPHDVYININRVTSTDSSTFDKFAGEVIVEVECWAQHHAEIGDEVDDMVDQVKQAVLPTRTTTGIAQQPGFHFSSVHYDSESEVPVLQTGTGYIKAKIIRFRQTIVDNN